MPVRVESIANLKWLILVFYNAAFNDPNAVQNVRSRGGADLNEDLICGNLKKQLVLCYAKPHPPSPTNKSFSFLSSSTFPSWSSSCSSVGRAAFLVVYGRSIGGRGVIKRRGTRYGHGVYVGISYCIKERHLARLC